VATFASPAAVLQAVDSEGWAVVNKLALQQSQSAGCNAEHARKNTLRAASVVVALITSPPLVIPRCRPLCMLIGAIGDRQLVLSSRKRQSCPPKVPKAICATVRLASNRERPALGRIGSDQVYPEFGHRRCECGK